MFKKIIITVLVLVSLGIMAFKGVVKTPKEHSIEEEEGYAPVVVLELYTSQGCSSCPSADLLLDKMKKQYKEEVIALSYHVDYWNYIGWKDPFSNKDFVKKQSFYNHKFRNRSNYTPQLVVNGKEHFVGSSASKMYAKVNAYKSKKAPNKITASNVSITNGKVFFNYDVLGYIGNKQLKTVLVLDERTTHVKRGENSNRTLKNSNIVVAQKLEIIEEKNGKSFIDIPAIVNKNEAIQLILLVENDNNDIAGATKVALRR